MITYHEVKELFDYDAETGHLIRNGKTVGTVTTTGHLKVKIKGKSYLVHRLIFLYCYGRWPVRIDHIDRNGLNNKLDNLRECSHSTNNLNRGLMTNNTSGYKGVHFIKNTKNKWVAQIGYKIIGRFENKEDAARAYDKKAVELYGDVVVTNKDLGLLS